MIPHKWKKGDKVKIIKGIIGVTLIDRGKEYTIKECVYQRWNDEQRPAYIFFELPDNKFMEHYFHLTQELTFIDEDLFTL
jgi:hypothetical protein